jgi:sugar phosphate isomerase/epimerase
MLLGLHTYSFYLHGIGQHWAGFELPWPRKMSMFDLMAEIRRLGLDGLHLDDGALESLEAPYLKEVRAAAEEDGLYLEYNFSLDLGNRHVGIQHRFSDAIATARILGADIVKVSMDLERPRPLAASRFHPQVVAQLEQVAERIRNALPLAAEAGLRIAVENHCDAFSEEVLWLLDRVDSPLVGACVDTVNALMVTENPMQAIENLAPRAFTNHFRDDRIALQRYGFKLTGTAVGEGDIDMRRAYELFRTRSPMKRVNIETEMEIPVDDMGEALRLEKETVERSVRYCREVLGIEREAGDR